MIYLLVRFGVCIIILNVECKLIFCEDNNERKKFYIFFLLRIYFGEI